MADERLETVSLPSRPDEIAPDGSAIRVLARLAGGSMAHGTLEPGRVSQAICHRTVGEIWYVLGGTAEIWRRLGDQDRTDTVRAGDSLSIPAGTRFQFRTIGAEPFTFIMCTMPPWPGAGEAIAVEAVWTPDGDDA